MTGAGAIKACSSCGRNVLFARTHKGALMPLEYDQRAIPEGTVRNVAYVREGGVARCYTLKAIDTPDTVELYFGTDQYVLTVAHFVVCEQANLHRKARKGEVPGVVPFPTAAERAARRRRP